MKRHKIQLIIDFLVWVCVIVMMFYKTFPLPILMLTFILSFRILQDSIFYYVGKEREIFEESLK